MHKIKIAHVAYDEKFIDMGMRAFENVSGFQNRLFLYAPKGVVHVSFVPTELFREWSAVKGLIRKLSAYDVVVFHSLLPSFAKLISFLPKKTPIIWIGWGFDYYPYIEQYLATRSAIAPRFLTRRLIDEFYWGGRAIKWRYFQGIDFAIERISVFSPVIPSEYQALKDAREWAHFPAQGFWNYGTLEDDLVPDQHLINGDNILLGNSATPTNFHEEAIEILANINLDDRKVICPLSYGSSKYAKKIARLGIDRLGDKFKPVTDFVSLLEYREMVRSCSTVIMNHRRQQAVHNLVMAIYMGASAYLRPENPVYDYFRGLGVCIFSSRNIEDESWAKNCRLDSRAIASNRDALSLVWSKKAIVRRTESLIDLALSIENRLDA